MMLRAGEGGGKVPRNFILHERFQTKHKYIKKIYKEIKEFCIKSLKQTKIKKDKKLHISA